MQIVYKNIGTVTKKFHGVEFKPGDTKAVDGYINADSFIRIDGHNPRNTKTTASVSIKPEPKVESAPKPEPKKVETKKDESQQGSSDTK